MKKFFALAYLVLIGCNSSTENNSETPESSLPNTVKPVIVIHGGAGNIHPERYTTEEQQAYKETLKQALGIGYSVLDEGGSSLEAVEKTIRFMEDSPLFNAGKGSVYNSKGLVENDASIMDGATLNAGAVAGVIGVKNPISLARLVKDSTKHVMLSGEGASVFATQMGVEQVDQRYYFTDERWEKREAYLKEQKLGTVGCVALDIKGNLAAGTSTGGMMLKQFGRVGDAPIIGAGTYADNEVAAVSCTGHGEYFIKNAVAYDVIAQLKYMPKTLEQVANNIIKQKLVAQGAQGGLIAVDKRGNIAMSFNTTGMFRGFLRAGDTAHIALFSEVSK